jgi:hypothetical protein
MDPNTATAADVYALGLWMVKVLYCTLVMGAAVVCMVAWNVAVTRKSIGEKKALINEVRAVLSAMQAEGRMAESSNTRTRSNLERTERVLEKAVATVAAVQSVPPTPGEGTLRVVVVNPPDHPVPVVPPPDPGATIPDAFPAPPAPPKWKPGAAPGYGGA